MSEVFILDSNFFITAKNNWYPFANFPTFWEELLKRGKDGKFVICKEVYDEIVNGEDDLSDWIKDNKDTIKILSSNDEIIIKNISLIMNSLQNNLILKSTAIENFAKGADPIIIAHAIANNYTLITQEKNDPNCKRKVLIPNVCNEFGVKWNNALFFIKSTGFRI